MLTLGIDPGLSGALALLNAAGLPEFVTDLPIIRDKSLAWVDGAELQSIILGALRAGIAVAFVERVLPPGQGITSSFQFGVGFGSILGVLQVLHTPIEFVTPAVWKRSYGPARDKHANLHKAQLMFPTAEVALFEARRPRRGATYCGLRSARSHRECRSMSTPVYAPTALFNDASAQLRNLTACRAAI